MLNFAQIGGINYKHITIVKDYSSIVNKWLESLTDHTRVVIYHCNMYYKHITIVNDDLNLQNTDKCAMNVALALAGFVNYAPRVMLLD